MNNRVDKKYIYHDCKIEITVILWIHFHMQETNQSGIIVISKGLVMLSIKRNVRLYLYV